MKKFISTLLIAITLTTAMPRRSEAMAFLSFAAGAVGTVWFSDDHTPGGRLGFWSSAAVMTAGFLATVSCFWTGGGTCALAKEETPRNIPGLTPEYLAENGYDGATAAALIAQDQTFIESIRGNLLVVEPSDNSQTLGAGIRTKFPAASEEYVQLLAVRLGVPVAQ
ncbi:hypothetical protein K2X30_14330 [bacterium]|jgi:hypothetical protein|nr:hypothetical protein [bacterium]